MSCVGRLLLATLTTVVASACPLPPVGDLGSPFFELSVQVEDEGDTGGGGAASAWATPRGQRDVVTERIVERNREFFAIYEGPPDGVFVGGVARLDVSFGRFEDLDAVRFDDDDAARARLAVTRTTLWCSERTWRDVDADAVPFDLDDVNEDVFGDTILDFNQQVVLFIDSPIPGARRCGDDVQAGCPVDCDIVTGVGEAACCAAAHDAVLACDALVVSNQGVARLHRLSP